MQSGSDDGFRVDVFDAGGGRGSGRRPRLADTVPFLLHPAWMRRAVPAPELERLRFADELDDARLGALPDDLAVAALPGRRRPPPDAPRSGLGAESFSPRAGGGR